MLRLVVAVLLLAVVSYRMSAAKKHGNKINLQLVISYVAT